MTNKNNGSRVFDGRSPRKMPSSLLAIARSEKTSAPVFLSYEDLGRTFGIEKKIINIYVNRYAKKHGYEIRVRPSLKERSNLELNLNDLIDLFSLEAEKRCPEIVKKISAAKKKGDAVYMSYRELAAYIQISESAVRRSRIAYIKKYDVQNPIRKDQSNVIEVHLNSFIELFRVAAIDMGCKNTSTR